MVCLFVSSTKDHGFDWLWALAGSKSKELGGMCPSEMTSRLGVRIMCWSGMTHHKVTCFQDIADKFYCFAQSNNHLIRGKQ